MRRFPRFESREQVRLQVGDRDEMRVLWTQDISCGGLFVQTEDPPMFGSRVTVMVETPDGSIALTTEVVHVLPREVAEQFGRSPGVGLQFVDLTPEQRHAIEQYVDGIAQQLTQEITAPPATASDVVATVQHVLQAYEENDLYDAIGVDPRSPADEIAHAAQTLIRQLESSPPDLTPAQSVRAERALKLLRKVKALLLDTGRRLDYDLRRDLVYARERLADATLEEADALRSVWCEVHPDRLDQAELHAAEALRHEQSLDLERAIAEGSAALHCDPFNVALRGTIERWRRMLAAREEAPRPKPSPST